MASIKGRRGTPHGDASVGNAARHCDRDIFYNEASRSMLIEYADEHTMGGAVDLVDDTFLRGRGRAGSVTTRYPNLFGREGKHRAIVIARSGREVLGAAVVKRFQLAAGADIYSGAMVGFVCSNPEARNQGVGSEMMRRIACDMSAGGIDFGVLWATRHGFYARLGWLLGDEALFGTITTSIRVDPETEVVRVLPPGEMQEYMEAVRSHTLQPHVQRTHLDYRVTPPSVDAVRCFASGHGPPDSAYLLVGVASTITYVYELAGNSSRFPALWEKLEADSSTLGVNTHPYAESGRWLAERLPNTFALQQQSMWLPLSARMAAVKLGEWYIPVFDRI